ncbi:tRNA 2-thiouridine(34) synthase MnmA [Candidatus Kaiserbacteria bacterium GWA2_50_9]|uniref:tRNA-uridine 2-sulfurtransferase n=1 Tax=Candidatus Kaiserbacteria bacterium GWA2_50_9 TaxID=1798474 RepID=A0A1F6BSX0_9BACT|nr:MAG: tRNA 2-thiouridine(34) synthase MnmA [Candidatus Kaiserbacteria bacterium GWA2_50_9]
MNVKGRKIFIGLSGGVDSAVSAALLKERGAQVTGVFIKGWYPPGMPCTWANERRDAMRVAARLHIPFLTLDASAEYKKSVIDYLIAEYRAGRTPNPDVMCNREVKFGAFYRFAKENGADAIAMGHYRSGEKDQSYFLWAVPKNVLAATLFPVGQMEKSEVRKLAKKFNLPVAEKKDSQGICFLGSVSVKEFLEKELGADNPALLYTIGQRVPRPDGPWYVIGKDVAKKEVAVSRSRKQEARTEIKFENQNWFIEPTQVTEAQYRYRGVRIQGRVEGNHFVSDEPLPDLPVPGQSIVFYRDGELIGGGIIAG